MSPAGKMVRTRMLILEYLQNGPARTSDIRKFVIALYPDAAVYGAMGELHCNGDIRRLTHERDARWSKRA
jgi:hypothetical protein